MATGFSQSVMVLDNKIVKGAFYFDSALIRDRTENGVETLTPKPEAQSLGMTYDDAEMAAFEFARDNNY
jgi:hypothetical protein